ncbi:MAG: DEAD/DEAH box helicase [Planctomycetota bacterium]
MEYRGLQLDLFQEQAIKAIEENNSVLVSAPTGSVKTLVAEYALEKCIRENKGIIYTAPIKALSNQKFRDFRRTYGDKIGIVTGDVSINPDAPALIMTTEIFRNTIFDDSRRLDSIEYVIFDEIHFLDDEDRGTVWEESLIFAPPHIKIIALSATILNLDQLARWIKHIRKNELVVIEETERPVPLKHLLFMQHYGIGNLKDLAKIIQSKQTGHPGDWRKTDRLCISRTEIQDRSGRPNLAPPRRGKAGWKSTLIDHIQQANQLPCLYFVFNRRECEKRAEENTSRNLLTEPERHKIMGLFQQLLEQHHIDEADRTVGFLKRIASRGIAFHHAGMRPDLKEIAEQLFTSGLIKLLFATETFALGINMPARSVIFDTLRRFDGVRETYLKTREYQQMSGRAGRRGIDQVGHVYSNLLMPCFNYRMIERIMTGEIEKVNSQFNLSYACILNLYHELKDRIYQICAKSFSNFQNLRPKRKKRRTEITGSPSSRNEFGTSYSQVVEQVNRKLTLLKKLGYLENNHLTEKGRFAQKIYGYELEVTELFFNQIIPSLTPEGLSLLAVSIVFESKKSDWYRRLESVSGGLTRFKTNAARIINNLLILEQKMGIFNRIKPLDFKLSGTTYAWVTGAGFGTLSQYTSASGGDLIRTFRLAAQLLRSTLAGLRTINLPRDRGTDDTAQKIKIALQQLYRDEVDAEKFLLEK